MKNQNKRNKKSRRKFWKWALIIIFLFLIGWIINILTWDSDRMLNPKEEQNTIKIYIDENFSDVNNLKKIHLANVYISHERIYLEIFNDSRNFEISLLNKSLEEINQKENLSLMIEPELGLLQSIEVSKSNPLYIYAVAEYLQRYFSTEIAYTYRISKSVLYGAKCAEEYYEIDTDLQKANYCEIDSDCKTLPLAGPYIEFGCYHYINKDLDSKTFYNKMNKYSAECGNVINLCRMSPEPKCENKICVEKDSGI